MIMPEIFSHSLFYPLLVLSYVLGAIPFGFLITKCFFGFDVREKGSGNIGSTNVLRTSGKIPGFFTLLLDGGKGTLVILMFIWVVPEHGVLAPICGAAAVILGHTKSIFLRGQGGKGVATNFGVWIVLSWPVFIIGVLTWLSLYRWKKISSLSALGALVSMPLTVFALHSFGELFYFCVLGNVYIVLLHQSNIKRLLSGKENKI